MNERTDEETLRAKPCPFCGSDDIGAWVRWKDKHNRFVYLECNVCGAKTKARAYYDTGDELNMDDIGVKSCIDAWNRRV